MWDFGRALGIFSAAGLAAVVFAACSQSGDAPVVETSVTATKQALTPGWTPQSLGPAAWYVASTSPTDVDLEGTHVKRWIDRTSNHNDASQATDSFRPILNTTQSWNGQPTLTFQAHTILTVDNWTSTPSGTDTPLTILAVVRSASQRTAGVVAWWDTSGAGNAWAGFLPAGHVTLPDFWRAHEFVWAQDYTGPHDVGTTGHVIVWRFSPATQIIDVTLDGARGQSHAFAPVAGIPQLPLIIGATSMLPTGLLDGDISELVIVPAAVLDVDIDNFTEYARNTWSGLPAQGSADPCRDVNGVPVVDPTRCDDGNPNTVADACTAAGTCVGQAPPLHSPAELGPTAWYHAGQLEIEQRDGRVTHWYDRTVRHLDLLEGFYPGRPQFAATGWNDQSSNPKPTVHFSGQNAIRRLGWTDPPAGVNSSFTLLAVVQKLASQNTGLASWWTYAGAGHASCLLKPASSGTTLDLFRQDENVNQQDFPDTRVVDNGRHVLAWRYSSGSAQITIDGNKASLSNSTALGLVAGTEFLVGAQDDLSTSLFQGDLSELVVIPKVITDEQVVAFDDYAQGEWGGLTFCTPTCGTACDGPDGCGGVCSCTGSGGTGSGGQTGAGGTSSGGTTSAGGTSGSSTGGDGSGATGGTSGTTGSGGTSGSSGSGGTGCTQACEGKTCGADDGCGAKCTCPPGTSGCTDDSDCNDGATCQDGTCIDQSCFLNPMVLGCGYPGAPCGEQCTPHPVCTADTDCPTGYVCPLGNGWRYGVPTYRVCEKPDCATTPDLLGCGGPMSECGLCEECLPNCAEKHCGDADLSDGCGSNCAGICGPQESGCRADSECVAGYVCRAERCRPADPCTSPTLLAANCGSVDSLCGPCPKIPFPYTTELKCGLDPNTGQSVGSCPGGQFCNAAGRCALLESTPDISTTTLAGTTRTVTPPPSPPTIGNVGALPGVFSVSDLGSAMYSVPLDLPPGRSVTPSLALRYTSSTANGALGVGWSLDGLSTISRCQHTFAQDDYTLPINGLNDDAYCLDGQRLVKQADGTYRTATDTFTKIYAFGPAGGGPATFIAKTKDGRKLTYGGQPSSRIAINGATGTIYGTFSAWALDFVEDGAGNYMRVLYRQSVDVDPVTGNDSTAEIVPSVITYTGHGTLDGDREVVFNYRNDRHDALVGWRPGGQAFARSLLLDHIDIRAQDRLVHRYSLDYEQLPEFDVGGARIRNNASRLHALLDCVDETLTTCKNPTTFSYIDEIGFEPTSPSSPISTNTYFDIYNGHTAAHTDPTAQYAILPVGIPHRVGTVDRLSTACWNTYVTQASPWYGVASFAASLIPYVGPAASTFINVMALSAVKVKTLYTEYDLHVDPYTCPWPEGCPGNETDPNYIDYSSQLFTTLWTPHTPCPSGLAPTSYVVAHDPANGDAEDIVNECTVKRPTGAHIPPAFDQGGGDQYMEWGRNIWYPDVNGDGVQDKLQCDPDNHTLYWKLSSPLTLGVQVPIYANQGNSDGSIQEYGHVCDPDFSHVDPTRVIIAAERGFSTTFDVNGDGTSDLVVYDGKGAGWAALLFDADGVPHWRHDLFEEVGILANHRYFVTILDANGDGLKDMLGLPDLTVDATRPPVIEWNTGNGFRQQILAADPAEPDPGPLPLNWRVFGPPIRTGLGETPAFPAFVLDYDHDGVEELIEPTAAYITHPWRVRRIVNGRLIAEAIPSLNAMPGTMGDFDGDGNPDVLAYAPPPGNYENTFTAFYKGKGRKNGLLDTIVDGLGHKIEVTYDGQARPNPSSPQCAWPTRCTTRVEHAVVSAHRESHLVNGQPVLDRQVLYNYGKWQTDMAGYGPLGFDTRTITELDSSNQQTSSTVIEYANPGPQQLTVPYARNTAGLVTKTTVHAANVAQSGIEGYWESMRYSETVTDWQVGTSDAGQPFPFATSQTTTVGTLLGAEGVTPLFRVTQTNTAPDGFGNVWHSTVDSVDLDTSGAPMAGSETSLQIDRTFTPTSEELQDWAISLVKSEDVTSTPRCAPGDDCAGRKKYQHRAFQYYPDSHLLLSVDRELGVSDQAQTMTFVRDPEGNVRQTIQDDHGSNVREIDTDYDVRNLYPISVTRVANGLPSQQTQVRYDDRFGGLVAKADPNGIDEVASYDEFGLVRIRRGPDGASSIKYEPTTAYTVPLNGGVALPAALRVTTTQLPGTLGQPATSATSVVDFNSFGQPVRTSNSGFNGEPVYQEFVYDRRHRLYQAWRPHAGEADATQGYVQYTYDAMDRLIQQENPDGGIYHRDYADIWNLAQARWSWLNGISSVNGPIEIVATTDPNLHVTVQATNRLGQAAFYRDAEQIRDGLQTGTAYQYEGFDYLHLIDSLDGSSIEIDHDAYGRIGGVVDQARGGLESTSYDGLDEVTGTTDPLGRQKTFIYDGFGRLRFLTDDAGDASAVTEYTYDGDGTRPNEIGRLIGTRRRDAADSADGGQFVAYGYEPILSNGMNRGLLNTVTRTLRANGTGVGTDGARTLQTKYTYDDFSDLQQVDYPSGPSGAQFKVAYIPDGYGHTIGAVDADHSSTVYWKLVTPDQGYRIGEEQIGTANCGATTGTRTIRTYDPARGTLQHLVTTCDGRTLQDTTYEHDSAFNLKTRIDNLHSTGYNYYYDPVNRLVGVNRPPQDGQDYVYDPSHRGRLFSQQGVGTYTYEDVGKDWVKNVDGRNYHHDDAGNITQRSGAGVPGTSQIIGYTPFDLPRIITPTSGDPTSFAYDADGERVIKKTGTGSALFYAGDIYQRAESSDGSILHKNVVYVGGRPVAQVNVLQDSTGYESTTTTRLLYEDILGSIETVTDGDAGVLSERNYSPFGVNQNLSINDGVSLGFTGQEEEPDIGLINMHGRMYDPVLAQFMSPDPVLGGQGQELNRYAYAFNSPLNYVDPSGFSSRSAWNDLGPGIAGVGIIGGLAALSTVSGQTTVSGFIGAAPTTFGSALASDAASTPTAGLGDAATIAGPANAAAQIGRVLEATSESPERMIRSTPGSQSTQTRTPAGNAAVPPVSRAVSQVGTSLVQERPAARLAPLAQRPQPQDFVRTQIWEETAAVSACLANPACVAAATEATLEVGAAIAAGATIATQVAEKAWDWIKVHAQAKGERGKTAKPSGTENEWKKFKPHPTKQDKVLWKDPHSGKWIEKPKPPGFDEYWKGKQPGP